MKLLRNLVRLCITGIRAASGRGVVAPRGFSVTVPPPLTHAAGGGPVVIELQRARLTAKRHEPLPPLKASRHLKLVSSR
jgi:hypothetical protein